MLNEHLLEFNRHGGANMDLHGKHTIQRPALFVEIDKISRRMSIDPVTMTVPFHQDAILVPLTGSEFLDFKLADHPPVAIGIHNHFLTRVREDASALFFIEHAVVSRFVGHDITLVARHHVEPAFGSVSATVLNSTVTSLGNPHLDS